MPLESLSSIELATMEAQYRFLKSMEMGFGVFAIAYRHDIFQSRKANAVFLTGVFAGVAARSLSFVLDGRPSGIFVAFLILELACGAAVFLVSRKTAVNP